jgi:hypothetical protein
VKAGHQYRALREGYALRLVLQAWINPLGFSSAAVSFCAGVHGFRLLKPETERVQPYPFGWPPSGAPVSILAPMVEIIASFMT